MILVGVGLVLAVGGVAWWTRPGQLLLSWNGSVLDVVTMRGHRRVERSRISRIRLADDDTGTRPCY